MSTTITESGVLPLIKKICIPSADEPMLLGLLKAVIILSALIASIISPFVIHRNRMEALSEPTQEKTNSVCANLGANSIGTERGSRGWEIACRNKDGFEFFVRNKLEG